MTSKEKKDFLLKEVIKPGFQNAGYEKTGETYNSVRKDCCIAVRIQSSHFNSAATGYTFWLNIAAFPKDVKKETLKEGCFREIRESVLLPDCGFLHPYRNSMGYQIDGYKDYKPQDMDVEKIRKRISEDLSQYILPKLQEIETISEWEQHKQKWGAQSNSERVRLIRYFEGAQMQFLDFGAQSAEALSVLQTTIGVSAEEIRENQSLYEQVKGLSGFPNEDKWKFIMAAL